MTEMLVRDLAPRPAPPGAAPSPQVVAWNLTRRCNLHCVHCYLSARPDAPTADELDTDECRRIADEILALEPSPMFIFTGGEPLLRDDLEALIRHASAGGATAVVGTNATLLDEERLERLAEAGLGGAAVSMDSLRPSYHDRFRRGEGALERTLAAIGRLRARRVDFVVQCTLTRGNRAELEALVEQAAALGAVAFNAYLLVETGRGRGLRALTPGEGEAVLEELADLHRRHFGRLMVRAKCAPQFMRVLHRRFPDSPVLRYATRCPCGVTYCRIAPDGTVTPCPYLPAPAGSLRERGFAAIWRDSELLGRLRAGAPGGKCGRCGYREMCGGCRARAFAASGDPLGPDPSCVHEPRGEEPLVARAPAPRYGDASAPELAWSEEARARIERIPGFVRAVVVRRIEAFARRRGETTVTPALLDEARRSLPPEIARRRPAFLRGRPR